MGRVTLTSRSKVKGQFVYALSLAACDDAS